MSYGFQPIALLGHPAPGGGTFTFDFEAGGLNNSGQVVFTADLSVGGEGIFLGSSRGLSQVFRAGQSAPGGGTFGGFGSFSPDAINDPGDAAIAFGLEPFTTPLGANAGVYRYNHANQKVTAVLVPGVTPVPGGGTFAGTYSYPRLNNGGDLAFVGMVPASIGPGAPVNLGLGVFLADNQGHLTKVARPGDAAPGGNTFDFAYHPDVNNRGDVAFEAHIASDPCIAFYTLPNYIFCAGSVYVRSGDTGVMRSIAHQGAAIPASAGGGTFDYAYAPVLNSRGQILFDAGLLGTTSPLGDSQAIFLYSDGKLLAIARQGDSMPGGGHLVSATFTSGNYDLNNNGDVAFSALLDTGAEGVFVRSHGSLTLVAKTGTAIPGVGTIASLDQPGGGMVNAYVRLNDGGQVAFGAVLTSGDEALLLATPTGGGAPAIIGDPGTSGPENDAALASLLAQDRATSEGAFGENLLSARIDLPSPGDPLPTPLPAGQDSDATPHGALVSSSSHRVRDRLFANAEDQRLDPVFVDDLSLGWVER